MTIPALSETNLFKPITIGDNLELTHRIVLAPLTRLRAIQDNVVTDLHLAHYDARSKTPGSLLISEGTVVSSQGVGYHFVPGIFNERQVQAWKIIVDKVHANGSYMVSQLWLGGRQADVEVLTKYNGRFRTASDDAYINEESREAALKLNNPLKAFTKKEIEETIEQFAKTAENAVNTAGFDMVEIHAANGYLFDQFFLSSINKRTDEYGGSIENRARFFLEVVDAAIERVGGPKVGCRISPWSTSGDMPGINDDPHPYATFGYILSELEKRRKKHGFAYVNVVEPRVSGQDLVEWDQSIHDTPEPNNNWMFEVFKGVIIRCGDYFNVKNNYNFESLVKDVNQNNRTLIGIGRPLTSNPDYVERLRNGHPLTPYDRNTFYNQSNYGYNTFGSYGDKVLADDDENHHYGKPLA